MHSVYYCRHSCVGRGHGWKVPRHRSRVQRAVLLLEAAEDNALEHTAAAAAAAVVPVPSSLLHIVLEPLAHGPQRNVRRSLRVKAKDP